MQEIGHAVEFKQIDLEDGDPARLPCATKEFDWVVETWVEHPIKDHEVAVSRMYRAADVGALIFDSNDISLGSLLAHLFKRTLNTRGLLNAFSCMQTGS